MAKRYVTFDRDQLFLLPPDAREWLPADHLAWFVLDAVAQIDTTPFHTAAPDGRGRPAYDPDLLVALLAYSYCLGRRSPRDIEEAARTDVAYRVTCGGQVPDHSTTSRFRKAHLPRMLPAVRRGAGLMPSRGAVRRRRRGHRRGQDDRRRLACGQPHRRDHRPAGQRADRRDRRAVRWPACPRPPARPTRRGPGPPGSGGGGRRLAALRERLARLRDAAAQLQAKAAQAAAANAERAAKAAEAAAEGRKLTGRRPKGAAGADAARADVAAEQVKAAQRKQEWETAQAAHVAAGHRRTRRVPDFDKAVRKAEQRLATAETAAAEQAKHERADQANVTDPDSRVMKPIHGWLEGFNAQAAVNRHQIVLAAAVTQDAFDVAQLLPMIEKTQAALDPLHAGPIGTVLVDNGYWSEDNATAPGPDRLIATAKSYELRRQAREQGLAEGPPPEDATTLEAMEHRLRTAAGHALYKLRGVLVEPVFGQIEHCRAIRGFSCRGLAAAEGEWQLICATHNLLKLYRHRQREQQATNQANTVPAPLSQRAA